MCHKPANSGSSRRSTPVWPPTAEAGIRQCPQWTTDVSAVCAGNMVQRWRPLNETAGCAGSRNGSPRRRSPPTPGFDPPMQPRCGPIGGRANRRTGPARRLSPAITVPRAGGRRPLRSLAQLPPNPRSRLSRRANSLAHSRTARSQLVGVLLRWCRGRLPLGPCRTTSGKTPGYRGSSGDAVRCGDRDQRRARDHQRGVLAMAGRRHVQHARVAVHAATRTLGNPYSG